AGDVFELVQISGIAYHLGNSADAKRDDRLSEKHRLKNAETEAFLFRGIESGVRGGEIILYGCRLFSDDHLLSQTQLIQERLVWVERTTSQDEQSDPIAA